MSKHTPGPWNMAGAWKGGHGVFDIIKPHPSAPQSTVGYVIATVSYSWNQDDGKATDETIANARLISAAPDLLLCVEELAAMYENTDAPIGFRARAAIAKARGKRC